MNKPRILVLAAAGRTGMPVALQLLDEGFPVTAFVHQADEHSERLQAQGADIVVGSLTNINDMRTAMAGARRAYFCFPNEAGYLKAAAIFTVVAARQPLEAVVAMSQWLSNPNHPSVHTREIWLADRLFALLAGTAVTFINPGFFADNEMQVLPFAAQFGLLSLPYGSGLNAPPSNEDMARVAAEILAITGREAEDFETIARRPAATIPGARRSFATQFKLMLELIISLLRPTPRTAPYLALGEFSERSHVAFRQTRLNGVKATSSKQASHQERTKRSGAPHHKKEKRPIKGV